MVVRVKDDRVTLVTDANHQEITVFSRDLRAAADSSGPVLGSKYDLFDLVQLDAANVACVVKVDRESLQIVDQHGSVRTLLPSNISHKLDDRRRTVATDRDGNEIHVEDTVKEIAGQSRSGEVRHIHRNVLFVHDKRVLENTGIFVARSSGVTITSAKGGRVLNSGPDLTKINPALLQAGVGNGNIMGPPKGLAMRDRIVGKTVLIKRGQYKGLIGIVKDTTDSEGRVELHTRKNLVTVPKEWLVQKDPITGETIQSGPGSRRPGQQGQTGGAWGNSAMPTRTPLAGSRTPLGIPGGGRTPAWQQGDGGRTPAWKQGGDGGGGRTPAWANASRTPAWQPDSGGRTVNPYAQPDGSRTSYGGVSHSQINQSLPSSTNTAPDSIMGRWFQNSSLLWKLGTHSWRIRFFGMESKCCGHACRT